MTVRTLALLLIAACGTLPAPSQDPPASARPVSRADASPSVGDVAQAPLDHARPAPSEEEVRRNEGCRLRRNSHRLTACERTTEALGSFAPTPEDLERVARANGGVCYCADQLAEAAKACATKQGTGLVRFTLGDLGESTDCTVTVSSASVGERRWVRLRADNRDLATFYAVLVISELVANQPTSYYEGFNAMEEPLVRGATGVSNRLVDDWPTFSTELRTWMRSAP